MDDGVRHCCERRPCAGEFLFERGGGKSHEQFDGCAGAFVGIQEREARSRCGQDEISGCASEEGCCRSRERVAIADKRIWGSCGGTTVGLERCHIGTSSSAAAEAVGNYTHILFEV